MSVSDFDQRRAVVGDRVQVCCYRFAGWEPPAPVRCETTWVDAVVVKVAGDRFDAEMHVDESMANAFTQPGPMLIGHLLQPGAVGEAGTAWRWPEVAP